MTRIDSQEIANAWRAVRHRYWSRLGEDSQDLAQEACLQAWQYATCHPGEGEFKHLVLKIARRISVNWYRRQSIVPMVPLAGLPELAAQAGYDVEYVNRDLVDKLPIAHKYRESVERWMQGEAEGQQDRKYVFRAVRTCRAYFAGESLHCIT